MGLQLRLFLKLLFPRSRMNFNAHNYFVLFVANFDSRESYSLNLTCPVLTFILQVLQDEKSLLGVKTMLNLKNKCKNCVQQGRQAHRCRIISTMDYVKNQLCSFKLLPHMTAVSHSSVTRQEKWVLSFNECNAMFLLTNMIRSPERPLRDMIENVYRNQLSVNDLCLSVEQVRLK